MLKLKVCGMRNSDNIIALSKIKPEFIGFIFHEKSSRNISNNLIQNTPDIIIRVGVFVDENIDFILDKIKSHKLKAPQWARHLFPKWHQLPSPNLDQNFS
mgnify:CR=1 FL=1